MRLQEILNAKGTTVYTTEPEATLDQAVRHMVDHNIGALVVCRRDPSEGEHMVGIVTERDVLRHCATGRCDLVKDKVSEIMVGDVITASPDDSVLELMDIMTSCRIRHVPVVAEGRLVGMVSIGDLLKAHYEHLIVENHFMRDYIGA
jgi:CBS domain-containing protein